MSRLSDKEFDEALAAFVKRALDKATRSLGGDLAVKRLLKRAGVSGEVGGDEAKALLERAQNVERAAKEAQRARIQGALDAARAVAAAAKRAYEKTKDTAWKLVWAGASATIGAVVLPIALLYLAATSKTGKDTMPLLLAGAWALLTRTPPP
jgi:hypothetical protein